MDNAKNVVVVWQFETPSEILRGVRGRKVNAAGVAGTVAGIVDPYLDSDSAEENPHIFLFESVRPQVAMNRINGSYVVVSVSELDGWPDSISVREMNSNNTRRQGDSIDHVVGVQGAPVVSLSGRNRYTVSTVLLIYTNANPNGTFGLVRHSGSLT